MRVGWIGLGKIGTAMVVKSLQAGHQVLVYPRGAGLERARAAGAEFAEGYADLAAGSDLLFLCLFSDHQVRDVLFNTGVLRALPSGSTLVNHTTGSSTLAEEIADRAPPGVASLDAAFSGGEAAVEAGKLLIMAGGPAAALEAARPVLSCYAEKVFHMGDAGQGQRVKLLNNLLFAANLRNAAVLLRIAEEQSLVPAEVAQVLLEGSGASFAMRSFRNCTSIDRVLDRSRPYLVKDVEILSQAMAQQGIDVRAFGPTFDFFAET